MDPARSESAHQSSPSSITLAIVQTDAGMSLETTRSGGGNSATSLEMLRLKLNGAETISGDGENAIKAKAHWEGAALVVETSREIKGATVTTRSVYALSADAREMTVDKTLTVQHGYEGIAASPNSGHGKDVFVRAVR